MVWDGIARNFKPLLIHVEDIMKAGRYKQLLFDSGVIDEMNSLHGRPESVLQYGEASLHPAKQTKETPNGVEKNTQ
jgi:hypothetical protein